MEPPESLTFVPTIQLKSNSLETSAKHRRTRCKKGLRRNPKTGICEPYEATEKRKTMKQRPDIEPSLPTEGVNELVAVPSEALPMDEVPSEALPMDEVPSEALPMDEVPSEAPLIIESETISLETPTKHRRTRCKKGLRRNPKTGICEPYEATEKRKTMKQRADINEVVPSSQEGVNEIEMDIQGIPAVPITESETQSFLQDKEYSEWTTEDTDFDYLYPTLNDPNFALKIAKHKEFAETTYDGTVKDIRKEAERLCNLEFELNPHQLFVRNFLSLQTPYNSLLLYHGLGTGKTCSAIGIAEEMRSYLNDMDLHQKIFIIASPNMQENFRRQLFDESKLIEKDGLWINHSCIGSKLLKEINPTNLKNIPKERIVAQINAIIHSNYAFMGYIEFANYIHEKTGVHPDSGYSEAKQHEIRIRNIKQFFDGRLIIIDEVHNIRISDDNKKGKRIANFIMDLAKYTDHLRLLLLSATPMYNSYKEIIWLTNLMNLNDKRSTISLEDVFERDGSFKPARIGKNGEPIEGGRELLQRKLTGYVSYIRGENPYTFPFRIYPTVFDQDHHLFDADFNSIIPYPTHQLNTSRIEDPLKYIHVYVTQIGDIQEKGYMHLVDTMRNKPRAIMGESMPSAENMESYGYTMLQPVLEALNIVYPNPEWIEESLEESQKFNIDNNPIIGSKGLASVLQFKSDTSKNTSLKYNCEYKPEILQKYGRIFSPSEIGKYSSKIAAICEQIRQSKGIVLVFSQYIDGGAIPIALALEEMGLTRFGTSSNTKPLFRTPPTTPLDATTMKPYAGGNRIFYPAQYVMITGDKTISPNNAKDIAFITHPDNKDGHFVKVIIITKAAAEGLDFKFIRQVHILEPWYNMNRMEQIIGRAVRNQSHCALPFEERNVQIFLHATFLNKEAKEESADLYLYRFAEKKALQIGQVTRTLKEVAVDCVLNISQTNFTVDKLATLAENQNMFIRLSNGKTVEFRIGDNPRTDLCDYMDNCAFKCAVKDTRAIVTDDIKMDTYHTTFALSNYDTILKKIRELFKENTFYTRERLEAEINQVRVYPMEQIYSVLSDLLKPGADYLLDKYGRLGKLIRKGNVYAFQPLEMSDESISIYDRSVPVEYKHDSLAMKIADRFSLNVEQAPLLPGKMDEMEATTEFATIYYSLLRTFQENITTVKEPRRIVSKEADWYKHISNAISYLEMICGIPLETIHKYIIYHQIDKLPLSDRIILLKRMVSLNTGIVFPQPTEEMDDIEFIEKNIYSYLVAHRLTYTNSAGIEKEGYIFAMDTKCEIFMQTIEGEWDIIEHEEWSPFIESLKPFIIAPRDYAPIVGFMFPFKNKEVIFKTKDMTNKRRNNTGAKCDSAGRENVQIILGKIGGEDYKNAVDEKLQIFGICGIVEILLRYFTETRNKGKVWFLDMERAILNRSNFSTD